MYFNYFILFLILCKFKNQLIFLSLPTGMSGIHFVDNWSWKLCVTLGRGMVQGVPSHCSSVRRCGPTAVSSSSLIWCCLFSEKHNYDGPPTDPNIPAFWSLTVTKTASEGLYDFRQNILLNKTKKNIKMFTRSIS